MVTNPDPQLAAELFLLIEKDQGASYISDGIGNLPRSEILEIARGAQAAHRRCSWLLEGFIQRFSENANE